MVEAHTVTLLWFASVCGWMCCSALVEIDLELQLADDWINLSDKKRRERKQQARQLLLSVGACVLALISLSLWLVIPAVLVFGLAFAARLASDARASRKPAQTLNVAGNPVDIAGPALRAAVTMIVAMGCLSMALGHVAGPWISAEVHEHVLGAPILDAGDPHDVHGHVARHVSEQDFSNRHLRHLMHVHDVMRAHAANGTEVRKGIKHHLKTIGHVVGASAEVAKLIGKGVHAHVTTGIANTKRVASRRRSTRRGSDGESGEGAVDSEEMIEVDSDVGGPELDGGDEDVDAPEPHLDATTGDRPSEHDGEGASAGGAAAVAETSEPEGGADGGGAQVDATADEPGDATARDATAAHPNANEAQAHGDDGAAADAQPAVESSSGDEAVESSSHDESR